MRLAWCGSSVGPQRAGKRSADGWSGDGTDAEHRSCGVLVIRFGYSGTQYAAMYLNGQRLGIGSEESMEEGCVVQSRLGDSENLRLDRQDRGSRRPEWVATAICIQQAES